MEADKSKIYRVEQQPGDPERAGVVVLVKKLSVAEFPVAQRKSVFFQIDLVSSIFIVNSILLYSKLKNTQNNVWSAKLTYKISHQRLQER